MGAYYHRRPDGDYEQYESYGDYLNKSSPTSGCEIFVIILMILGGVLAFAGYLKYQNYKYSQIQILETYYLNSSSLCRYIQAEYGKIYSGDNYDFAKEYRFEDWKLELKEHHIATESYTLNGTKHSYDKRWYTQNDGTIKFDGSRNSDFKLQEDNDFYDDLDLRFSDIFHPLSIRNNKVYYLYYDKQIQVN